ncbi:MAG: 30S ribosomal protein S9 [Pseudomonadales bacterium]|nr:30S ribosomal protein S9 [Candidatus Woesebacteria bacterium]MCB9801735.1 30S ribosomal protein S9 [Pseudomonadales bacterium]
MALKLSKKTTTAKKIRKKQKKSVVVKSAATSQENNASTLVRPTGEYFEGIGRRKVATARVRLYPAGGDASVNGVLIGEYFRGIYGAEKQYMKPLQLTDMKDTFTLVATVSGSGISAQLDAIAHGVARALIKYDPALRTFLKPEGLLTRDDRMKETRKIGMGGSARRKRQSPKR